MAKKTKQPLVKNSPYLTVILVLLIAGGIYYLATDYKKSSTDSKDTNNESAVITPKPSLFPLPAKETTFQVSGGKKTGPKPSSVTFNPLAIKPNTDQTISVTLADTADIREVSALITTDNKTRTIKFALKEGTAKNGTWQANWQTDDTADSLYKVDFRFVGSEINNQFGYGFR